MYIFLDESGDLGFDFKLKKTSQFFVITLLACKTRQSLFSVRNCARKTLQIKLNYRSKRKKRELKGSHTNLDIKKYFYRKLSKTTDIKINSIILNKKRLLSNIKHVDPHRIYVRLSYQILQSVDIQNDASFVHVTADRCKRDREAEELSSFLKSHLESILPLTSRITIEQIPSINDFGLQAVDMFSYGVFRKYEHHDLEWYKSFEDRITTEVVV